MDNPHSERQIREIREFSEVIGKTALDMAQEKSVSTEGTAISLITAGISIAAQFHDDAPALKQVVSTWIDAIYRAHQEREEL